MNLRSPRSVAPLALCFALAGPCVPPPPSAPARAPAASAGSGHHAAAPHLAPRGSSGPYRAPPQRLGRDAVRAALPAGARLSAEEIERRHAVAFTTAQRFDLDAVAGMDAVQRRRPLSAAARAQLAAQGVAVQADREYPNFMSGYADLYLTDQPVYVSADALLNPLHLSFDAMIADIEEDALAPTLTAALRRVRGALGGAPGQGLSPQARGDLDVYLAAALGLLDDRATPTVTGAPAAAAEALRAAATRAEGTATLTLFGSEREVDLSQMRPRGHYAGVPARERYFRAVMFLGREGLRLVDTQHGRAVPLRRSVEAALGLRALLDATSRAALGTFDAVVAGFAGEPNALTVADLDGLDAEVTRRGGLASLSDADLLDVITRLRGDRPRVATTILHHPESLETPAPEPVALSFAAQRATPDAVVLSRVSYDRLAVRRMMPSSLDAAYGALGNDQALGLLGPELRRFDYATELEDARALIDAHEQGYWDGSLYAGWLAALRALSPRDALDAPATLPRAMTTAAWGARLLNTQLAAWSELRHDTVLYTAQSYSAVPGCSYPAGYVEPYPAFWGALRRWVGRGRAVVAQAPFATAAKRTRWERWLARADVAVTRLEAMAVRERAGQELSADQLAYLNAALQTHEQNVVCTSITVVDGGWYYDLFEPRLELGDRRAMVADVHTQPADESGTTVGRVLHIGTGLPRQMVVIAGPAGRERAYVGLASSYLERVTEGFDRLTDQRWAEELDRAAAPAWQRAFVVDAPAR